MLVCKFGGSSLADAEQFQKVIDIVLSNKQRRFIVPSAPGKRGPEDTKVTDLLYALYNAQMQNAPIAHIVDRIRVRYEEIARDLGLEISLKEEFNIITEKVLQGTTAAYVASRGEYLSGKLLASALGYAFVDATEVIRFSTQGQLMEEETNKLLSTTLSKYTHAVIPGFYGADENGEVFTFSRGGSDVSGALVARAMNADMYENFTDVTGFRMADPRIIKDAHYISNITYRELRELSYMGATVLHEDAVFPVRKAGIPTNIRNTNEPKHPGTMISHSADRTSIQHTITGIAGKKGFAVLAIEKDMMNSELGFGKRVLQAFEEFSLSFEHMPTGIDTLCIVTQQGELDKCKKELLARIVELVSPDLINVHENLALIATVGRGMVKSFGVAARLFTAISDQGISVRTIDQGSSELNIIVGVNEEDFERAVCAIYDTFVRE